LKLTTERHEASRGLSATAGLLVVSVREPREGTYFFDSRISGIAIFAATADPPLTIDIPGTLDTVLVASSALKPISK